MYRLSRAAAQGPPGLPLKGPLHWGRRAFQVGWRGRGYLGEVTWGEDTWWRGYLGRGFLAGGNRGGPLADDTSL